MFLLFLLLYAISSSLMGSNFDLRPQFLSDDPNNSEKREIQHQSVLRLRNNDIFKNATYAYSDSQICIHNTRFSMNEAFGDKIISGSGGAIFAHSSIVLIQDSVFLLNSAIVGGALSISNSKFFTKNTKYIRNIAYYMAGSIFSRNNLPNSEYFFYMQQTLICLSKSCEFYGAIYIENSNDTYFDKVQVYSSRTKNAGGGIGFKNSNVYMYHCEFKDNSVGSIIKATPKTTLPRIIFYYRSAPNIFINTNQNDIISDSFEANNNVPHINFNSSISKRLNLNETVLPPFIHFIYTDTLTFSPEHNLLILQKNKNIPLFTKESDEISFVINSETIININSDVFPIIENSGTNVYISDNGLYPISQTVSNVININIKWDLFLNLINETNYTQIDDTNNRYLTIEHTENGRTNSLTISFEGIKQSHCQKLNSGIITRYENNDYSIEYGPSWNSQLITQSYFSMKKVEDISQLYLSVRKGNSSFSAKSKVLFNDNFQLESFILESYTVNLTFSQESTAKIVTEIESEINEKDQLTKIDQKIPINSSDSFPNAPTFSKRNFSPKHSKIHTRYTINKAIKAIKRYQKKQKQIARKFKAIETKSIINKAFKDFKKYQEKQKRITSNFKAIQETKSTSNKEIKDFKKHQETQTKYTNNKEIRDIKKHHETQTKYTSNKEIRDIKKHQDTQTKYTSNKEIKDIPEFPLTENDRRFIASVHFLNQSCFDEFKPTELSFFFTPCFADINIISIFDEEFEYLQAPINANTKATIQNNSHNSNFAEILTLKVTKIINLMVNSLPKHITNCTLYVFIPSSPEVSIPEENSTFTSKILLKSPNQESNTKQENYVKGGGSVFFTADDNSKFELITNRCSFLGNRCINNTQKSNDMLFSGNTEWKSYMDIFSNPKNISFEFIDESIQTFDVTIYNSQFEYPNTDLIPGPKSSFNIDSPSDDSNNIYFDYIEQTYQTQMPNENSTPRQTPIEMFTKPLTIQQPIFPNTRTLTYVPTLIYSISQSQSYEVFFTYSLIPVFDTTHSLTHTIINNQDTYTYLEFTTNTYSYQRIETFSLTIADFPFSYTTLSQTLINTFLNIEIENVKGISSAFIIGIVISIVLGVLLIVVVSVYVYRSSTNYFIPFHDDDNEVKEIKGEETIIVNPILINNQNSHSDPFHNDFEEITLGEEPKYERF